MKTFRPLIMALLAATFLSQAAPSRAASPGDSPEMRDRSRCYLLNRGTQGLDKLLESPGLSPDQVQTITLLLQEMRSEMHLFLDYSNLQGDALQAKLQEVLAVTRDKVEIAAMTDAVAGKAPAR